MIEIGRLCVKIAGRDAGKKCLIIDILDDRYVLIDGETRRRRCNVLHLEPLTQVLKVDKDATHGDVLRALKEINVEGLQTKPRPKTQKPKKKRKTPQELREQKQEKKRIRDIFRPKKKEDEEKKDSLEAKAGLEEKHEHAHEHKEEKAAKEHKKENKGPRPAKKAEKKE